MRLLLRVLGAALAVTMSIMVTPSLAQFPGAPPPVQTVQNYGPPQPPTAQYMPPQQQQAMPMGMPGVGGAQMPGVGGVPGMTAAMGAPPPGVGVPGAGVPGMPPPAASTAGAYPQVQSSHCRYLMNAPSPWGTNAAPFKLYTRSYAGEVKRGYPVEVTLMPFFEAFRHFNFTDFGLWTEKVGPSRPLSPQAAEMNAARGGPPGGVTHMGVWQVFPQYAGGAGSMKCNMFTNGEDTVGSFQERMLELLKSQFPWDRTLNNFQPSARHGAAFLWYPDEETMRSANAVKFVAKLKSFGQWFKLESTPWRVYRPPPPRRFTPRQPFNMNNFNAMVENFANVAQQTKAMERKLDQAGAPGV